MQSKTMLCSLEPAIGHRGVLGMASGCDSPRSVLAIAITFLFNSVPTETLQSVPSPQEGQIRQHKNLADRSSGCLGDREFEFQS